MLPERFKKIIDLFWIIAFISITYAIIGISIFLGLYILWYGWYIPIADVFAVILIGCGSYLAKIYIIDIFTGKKIN